MPRKCLALLLLPLLASGMVGCAANNPRAPFEQLGKVWPAAPETARIAFVGEFSNSTDLGIEQGIWSKLVSVVVGARNDAMVRPMAVAVADDGQVILVADPGAHCVHLYDLHRGRYRCLTLEDGSGVPSPVGLALTNDRRVLVADSGAGQIYVASLDGKYLEPFTVSDALQQPTGISWDAVAAHLYVADTAQQMVKVFGGDGRFLRQFGGRGTAPGQLNYPTYLWMDEGQELLLSDSLNFRIQRFDNAGTVVSVFGQNGDKAGSLARPKGVAADSFGNVYVVDAILNSLQVFNRNGELLLSVGELGQQPGNFWLPNGLFISTDNTIFVADAHNKRVQVFRYIGPES